MTVFLLWRVVPSLTASFFVILILTTAGGCHGETSWPLHPETANAGPRWGVALDGYPITSDRLVQAAAETGQHPDVVVFFMAWPQQGDVPGEFPLSTLEAIHSAGALPCLTWEPMWLGPDGREHVIPASDILAGHYDVYLKTFAGELARWGYPLIIRFAHEMNLSRYHWGGSLSDYGPASPERYRQMFAYVVDICRGQGADNILWAFCPNAESVPQADWNQIAGFYPGDDVVDIFGIDGYNWGTTQTLAEHGWRSRWQSFQQIFSQPRAQLRALNPHKPLIIFETASVTAGGSQEQWLDHALKTAREWNISALIWFQALKENDWRIQPAARRLLENSEKNNSPKSGE
jgi:mannan endo-1,4-beta-mannosidase